MTQEERAKLVQALFNRALTEVQGGVLKDAVIAVELMERVTAERDTGQLLAWLNGDNGIPDGA